MSKETRERIAFRMQPETRRRIEQWYAADNCQSKNEFIEKAVNFYVDHLEIQDNQTLLPIGVFYIRHENPPDKTLSQCDWLVIFLAVPDNTKTTINHYRR